MKAIPVPGALAAGLALVAMTAVHAQAPPNIEDLLAHVGERVGEFYKRAQNVVCIETSSVQAIDFNYSPQGFARTVESELHLEADQDQSSGEATLARKILKVNGRAPREKDKSDRAACTDPNPLSSEPLAFLLPAHRGEYRFKVAGMEKDRDSTVLMIDFASVDRRSDPALIEDPAGHDDCFDWSGQIASRGRVWVDAENHNVVRVERGLPGPIDITVPALIQRRHHLDGWVALLRDDLIIRYKALRFSDPDEVLLLPESIDSVTIVRGSLQSTRRHQAFSDYKRFVTGGRVLQ